MQWCRRDEDNQRGENKVKGETDLDRTYPNEAIKDEKISNGFQVGPRKNVLNQNASGKGELCGPRALLKAVDVDAGNLTGKVVEKDGREGRNHEFGDLNLVIQSGVIEKDANKCSQRGEHSNEDQYEQHPDSTQAKMREHKDENYESHTMWENELVQVLIHTANLNINGEVWEHRLRDMVTEMERFHEDQDSYFETEDTALAYLGEEQNMPWWLEDDIEEDVLTKTSLTVPDSREIISAPEELLADWYQIEGALESTEGAWPEGNGDDIGNNEADPSKTEVLLAEWYLWEESLKAEGHLKSMELRDGIDDAKQIEIGSIVTNAAVKIRNVLDTAQAEIRKLLMKSDTTTTSDSTGSVNSAEAFEQDKDFLAIDDADQGSIWTKSCNIDSHCSNSALHLISSDTGVGTVEGVQLYLDFNGCSSREIDLHQETMTVESTNKCASGVPDMTNLGAIGLPHSWRWAGIRKVSVHRMPPGLSSGREQRKDATWRRKWRSYLRPTPLPHLLVTGYQHKVEYDDHYRSRISLHMIAWLTVNLLKVQLMGLAMRRQIKPLPCWRYSRTSTHGILQQQHWRDGRCTEHRQGPHVSISK